jgi:hypothetical protein
MEHYPLMFTFRDVVSGNGFLAGVTLSGRALIVKENDNEWCVYGVRPAAIAETGKTAQEAYLRFRNRYKTVLFDVSFESRDFESFKRETEGFYYAPDPDEEHRWEEATMAVGTAIGQGETVTDDPFLCGLALESPENRPSSIAVAKLDENQRFQASDNVADTFVGAKAVGAAA